MNLPSFQTVDLFSAAINALNRVLVPRNPSHNCGYAVVGLLIMVFFGSGGRVFILALVLDVVYQLIVLRFVYAGEAIIVAFILAIVPYLILRGLVTRAARKKEREVPTIRKQLPMSNAA